MQTQSNQGTDATPPTMLSSNGDNTGSIIPVFDAVMRMDRKLDAMQVLEKSADQSGFDFLFEMPGALFDLADQRVAVLNASPEKQRANHVFVLFASGDEIVSVLNYEEIPDQAKRFFCSYISVLSCLSDMPAIKNLH